MYITMRFNGIQDNRTRTVKNFCLMTIIYIHCFYIPLLSSLINAQNRFRENYKLKCCELLNHNSKKNNCFIENKKFLFKLFFLLKGKTKHNLLLQPLSFVTVSLQPGYGIRFFCYHFKIAYFFLLWTSPATNWLF